MTFSVHDHGALLDDMDIVGALVTADAAHTCTDTARYLVEDKNADYLLTINGNRPSLHAAAIAATYDLTRAEARVGGVRRAIEGVNGTAPGAVR